VIFVGVKLTVFGFQGKNMKNNFENHCFRQ